jgi:AcrR family transcriptional regulator
VKPSFCALAELDSVRRSGAPAISSLDRVSIGCHNVVMGTRAQRRSSRRTPHRSDVLDAASAIVSREGESALSVRRLAADLGTSTMVVYTHFSGKDELVGGLRTEGFRRFAEALAGAGGKTPIDHLISLGRAYRQFGLANASYYRLMWGTDDCLDPRSAPARPHGERAFDVLTRAVTAVMAERGRAAAEVAPAALFVWATVHGALLLELSGLHPDTDAATRAWDEILGYIVRALGSERP